MGRPLEDLTNEGVTFLREPGQRLANHLERPVAEEDIYKLWMRSGVIERLPKSRGITIGELVGLLGFAVALGFCLGYLCAF